jgi:ribonuclease HII
MKAPETETEIGVDEAGRGPLFGRVYCAAVILPLEMDFSFIKDSKKFTSKKKIREAADKIKQHALAWSVAFSDENTIDELNILQATMKAMHTCILDILPDKGTLWIDGNYFRPITRVMNEELVIVPYTCVEKGDSTYYSIAAASILAKVARDDYILDLCEQHPYLVERYGLDKNKGYGAKKHMDGIREHGITEWHRKSYKPCDPFRKRIAKTDGSEDNSCNVEIFE